MVVVWTLVITLRMLLDEYTSSSSNDTYASADQLNYLQPRTETGAGVEVLAI